MYLLGSVGGYPYQSALWRLLGSGRLVLHDLNARHLERMPQMMEKYRDTPMDLADASLLTVAESLSLNQIFSLDKDFFIYRLENGTALHVVR
jgi:uncharacterized protein